MSVAVSVYVVLILKLKMPFLETYCMSSSVRQALLLQVSQQVSNLQINQASLKSVGQVL